MASEEMEISQMLAKAKKVFDKFKDKVNMKNYKKVLTSIGVVADTDYELEQYFTIVDTDEDGFVNYKDFEATLLAPLMDEAEISEGKIDDGLTISERSLLTLEKLSEFKELFDYYRKGKVAYIKDMKEDILLNIKGFSIKLTEFETFFKEFSDTDAVKDEQFFKIYNFYEEKIFEKAEVYDKNSSTANSKSNEVEIEEGDNYQTEANQFMEEVIIGEEMDTGNEEDNDKDPEVSLQDIVDHIIDTSSFTKMGKEQLSKIFNKIKVKVDQVNTKMQKLEKKSKKHKNANDVLKNEKEYFQKKVKDLKDANEELKEAKYKLECDVEDLMKFEQDFHRMIKQAEEKDIELMRLEDQIDEYKRAIRSLELKQKSEDDFIGGTLTKDGLLDRIRNLELELDSYKSYVAMSLPTNKDFNDLEGRLSLRQYGGSQIKQTVPKDNEDADDIKLKNYSSASELAKLLDDLSEKNKKLSEDEQRALAKFEKEYQRKIRIIEETDRVKADLENRLALIMVENEALLKENQWRKEYNISNAKEIEAYLKDIKILERKVQELENEAANWKFKYENQELIKKNAQYNPQFQQAYIDIVSQKKTEDLYKGRLSQVVNIRASSILNEKIKSRAIQGTVVVKTHIANIKEENEDEEKTDSDQEDNLDNELGEFDEIDQPDFGNLEERAGKDDDLPFDQEPYDDGIIRASQLDPDRFTLMNKDRSSHINIGVVKRDFKKLNLPTIDEDEFYDPIKDKLKELRSQTNINKGKVIDILEAENNEDNEGEEQTFDEVLENKEETKEAPTPVEEIAQKIQDKVRATIAFVTKSHTKSTETQTLSKIEEVQIDDSKAFVIYEVVEPLVSVKEKVHEVSNEVDADQPINIEGEAQEIHKSEEQPASQRINTNSEVIYINDSTEAFCSGEVGRVMMKVHCAEGPTMLIDKGKHKIIEHNTIEIQTDEVAVVPSVEKVEVKPVAQEPEDSDDGDDSSDIEGEGLDDEEEKDLFKKLDSRQKELGVIDEEDDDGETIKIKNQKTEKEIQDEKKIQEISDKLKTKLDTQVRMSQLGGKGQGFLRDQSIINRISKIKNFDFLGLRSKDNKYFKRVTKILERYNDKTTAEGSECFTEYIKKVDTDFKEHKRKIMITRSAVYQLSKNFSVVNRVPLETIKGMTLIKKSATLIAIHCPGSYDHLVEIIRRTELVMFLMHMFDVRKLAKPKIYYADGLKTKTSGKNKVPESKILKFDPASKQNVGKDNYKLMSHLTSINFINSPKYGYLMKKSESWFKQWTEKFCVITNVGLLYYNDPSQKPRNLFPIIDAKIIKIEEKVFKKKFVFQIKAFKWEIIFATKNEQDYVEWMDAFSKLQSETDKKKSTMIEKGILNDKLLEEYKNKNEV